MTNQSLSIPNFKISFSFAGECRDRYILPVCNGLLQLGFQKDELFYDEWHSHLFSVANADTVFKQIYHDSSRCIVVFLSPTYFANPWTNKSEWPVIKELIKKRKESNVCLLRIGEIDINAFDGLSSVRDVAKDVEGLPTIEIAAFIEKWYSSVVHRSPTGDRGSFPFDSRDMELIEEAFFKNCKTGARVIVVTNYLLTDYVYYRDYCVQNIRMGVKYTYIVPKYLESTIIQLRNGVYQELDKRRQGTGTINYHVNSEFFFVCPEFYMVIILDKRDQSPIYEPCPLRAFFYAQDNADNLQFYEMTPEHAYALANRINELLG